MESRISHESAPLACNLWAGAGANRQEADLDRVALPWAATIDRRAARGRRAVFLRGDALRSR